ncbi:IS110 family transposase [Tessaracoccus sp. HDW20]|uniref:transposase n=1 Tax=Tessaracoccus coleopterorum TaxID=2714950 RepID=UPI0018D3374F|nr:transposase [Tessaracoccus coleopterorum]NHB84602.1 IS110 family transposase [Tessaracoccus coleopterorum]
MQQYPELSHAATRWLLLHDEAKQYTTWMRHWLQALAPELLARRGVGPVSATQLILAAGANPDRLVSEKALAALSGVAPIPISSGRIQDRYRLSRGGDRTANQAFWRIAFHRYYDTQDLQTQLYKAKRTALGDKRPTIIRLLKRAIVRELFRDLQTITNRLATLDNT